jgi:cob(I)alamin adenosyltransferase
MTDSCKNLCRNGEKGLLLNLCGNGKGKSSSAFGMVIRTLGWGGRAAVLQFVKSPDWETGEMLFFRGLASDRIIFESLGLGMDADAAMQREQAQRALRRMSELLKDADLDLLVLDELNIAVDQSLISVEQIKMALAERNPALNICITGRYADPEILALCDLISQVQDIEHPCRKGLMARRGLDY